MKFSCLTWKGRFKKIYLSNPDLYRATIPSHNLREHGLVTLSDDCHNTWNWEELQVYLFWEHFFFLKFFKNTSQIHLCLFVFVQLKVPKLCVQSHHVYAKYILWIFELWLKTYLIHFFLPKKTQWALLGLTWI